MRDDRKRRLYYALLTVAIAGSVASLYALLALGAPRWSTPVTFVSIACILVAAKLRGRDADRDDN